jgi:aminoglycoside phosphotransferase family enzyme
MTSNQQNSQLFAKRIAQHRIRDCHGDLHAGSIYLTDEIQIFDCIEFNDRFRYGDVAAEVAFLAMDLEHFGRTDAASTCDSSRQVKRPTHARSSTRDRKETSILGMRSIKASASL